ncbi:hypothetical protein [uncultured Bradyrhizobium sp.]|uniref:hypothetical protein n=1 Tax=uncultured Bradyrhizobium sp. TaxID=199684 RepID=UPI0026153824|nr:hypothetical protein [uncultured Bradyrhizobium sp.]
MVASSLMGQPEQRRFPPPWRIEQNQDAFRVFDANGILLAVIYCRDDLKQWSFGHGHLSSDEARRIAGAIVRLPELLMPRQGFIPRGGGHPQWRKSRPYHVALEDGYIRKHWAAIGAICRLNSLPFNATGERIREGGLWCVYEFEWQLDAVLFWTRFDGRWLRGTEFIYPEPPQNLPKLREPHGMKPFHPRDAR